MGATGCAGMLEDEVVHMNDAGRRYRSSVRRLV